ncbi:ParB/RepB/Spo0J family partition protein [Sphingomonas psychrotolerans]|uniref:Chromosome partitioning protein ParB n=1 Tax=Sphingomonas psychrotolerans TaxID=1327635 RepID=A0A2K8MGJ8_9SPHN|nr:ParB N-terminal domain-containing protein [Sphingomonas psychrotolerans]ATY32983.1 chromosome partitioning protein ParB [Sphingomonas psychrotolerans]
MELRHIALANLCISAANMRARGKPDLSHILPSIRARGVLVPLIVRPAEGDGRFEIVAGKRRYHAALTVAEESGGEDSLPCAVMAAGDDAAALEASLIENVARLDPDEVNLWESFTRLVREGRSSEDIALTFGLTELQVKRTLALGNLLPRIRGLYRRGDVDVATVRHLTLASKARQRDWLALLDDPETYCPTGPQLKAWLFGGASIPVSAALFDMANYAGEIVSDLFGEERYFADTASFWAAQTPAIEAKADGYREVGWREVVVLPAGETFRSWEHERCPKRKGGKVFLAVSARGEVTVHEGYISRHEAQRRAKGEVSQDEKPVRPEISAPIQNYVDLHRHAAVRADLADQPSLALRVMVAHAIAGSPLWNVRIEDQRATSDAIAESVESCASEARFDEKRRAVLALLGFDPETPTVTCGYDGEQGLAGLLTQLLDLPDPALLDILAIVMAETLEAGSVLVEVLGPLLGTDMAKIWQADDALLDLIKDREVLGHVLADVAGDEVAVANEGATGKVKRKIVRDCLTGENGRAKVESWVPKWMAFPPSAYTARCGVGTVSRAAKVADLRVLVAPQVEPQPLQQAA